MRAAGINFGCVGSGCNQRSYFPLICVHVKFILGRHDQKFQGLCEESKMKVTSNEQENSMWPEVDFSATKPNFGIEARGPLVAHL